MPNETEEKQQSQELQRRRRADNPLANWHRWSIFACLVALSFLGGQMLYMRSFESVRLTINAFFGAVLAVVVCYGAIAKQIFDNLEKMVKTGDAVNAGLEEQLEAEKCERKAAIEQMEARHAEQLSQLEARYQTKITELTQRVEDLNNILRQTLEEKFNLEEMLRNARRVGGKKPRVLLIDDNPEHLKMHTYFLELGEFDVASARNGVEGVKLFEEAIDKPFDVVICDVAMPDLSGEDTVKLLRLHGRAGVKIAMLTGFGPDVIGEFFKRERIAVWSKPVSQHELVRCVRALMQGEGC